MRFQSGKKVFDLTVSKSSSSQLVVAPGRPMPHTSEPLPKHRGSVRMNKPRNHWLHQVEDAKCVYEQHASLLSFQSGCSILQSKMLLERTFPHKGDQPSHRAEMEPFLGHGIYSAKTRLKPTGHLPHNWDPQTHGYRQEGLDSIFLPQCTQQNQFHSDKTCKRKM